MFVTENDIGTLVNELQTRYTDGQMHASERHGVEHRLLV